jgi:hypothetical protein
MEYQILSAMKKLLYLIPFLFLFIACEQDADVDIPETEPKLVISCFLTPQDSFIRAKITRSNPIFNSSTTLNPGPVTNATVTLYGNSTSIILAYDSATEYYQANQSLFPIIGGNEYKIVVTHPSGNRAEATTVIPLVSPANFQCTTVDSVYSSDPYYVSGETRFTYSFSDPAGVSNYYRFVIYDVSYSTFSGDTTLQRTSWDLFSDDNADGTTITQNSIAYYYENINSGDTLIGYDVWLLSGNEAYQRFHLSIDNYNGGGDPFSEPTLIYSNVTGGLGIFAGANSTHLRIPH